MLVACAVVLVGVLGMAVALVGGRVVDESRAQAAADAAALAAVSGGAGAAERIAVANDATIVSLVNASGTVTVVVDVDGARATARASAAP